MTTTPPPEWAKEADNAKIFARDDAQWMERITALEADRKMLRDALTRAERKLSAYIGVCTGDKELTDAVLPMARKALEQTK